MGFWEGFAKGALGSVGRTLSGATGPAGMAAAGMGSAALSANSQQIQKGVEDAKKRVREGLQGAAESAYKPLTEFATLFAVNAALVIMGLIGLWLIVRKA